MNTNALFKQFNIKLFLIITATISTTVPILSMHGKPEIHQVKQQFVRREPVTHDWILQKTKPNKPLNSIKELATHEQPTQITNQLTFKEPNFFRRLFDNWFGTGKKISSTMQEHNTFKNMKNQKVFTNDIEKEQARQYIIKDPMQFLDYLNGWLETNQTRQNESLDRLTNNNKTTESSTQDITNEKKEILNQQKSLEDMLKKLEQRRINLSSKQGNDQVKLEISSLDTKINSLKRQIENATNTMSDHEKTINLAKNTMDKHEKNKQKIQSFFVQRLINFRNEMQDLMPQNVTLMLNPETRKFEYHQVTKINRIQETAAPTTEEQAPKEQSQPQGTVLTPEPERQNIPDQTMTPTTNTSTLPNATEESSQQPTHDQDTISTSDFTTKTKDNQQNLWDHMAWFDRSLGRPSKSWLYAN